VLSAGALLNVSIWGALTMDGKTPELQAGIPQTSPLIAQPTSWAIGRAAEITGYRADIFAFVQNLKPGTENLEQRLKHTFMLQQNHALAATIEGTQVREATVYAHAKNLPVPALPHISYP